MPIAPDQPVVYRGSCNCGRFRYEVSLRDEIATATLCTCSHCVKKGYLWIYPDQSSIKTVRDEGLLQDYASPTLRDTFCSRCATGIFGEHVTGPLSGQRGLNIRAIHNVNPFQIEPAATTVETEDTRQTPLPYHDTPPPQQLFSCHCGKLQAELLTPLEEQEIKEDNCSSCVRNAYIGVYPNKSDVRIHGQEHAVEYWGMKAEKLGQRWGNVVHCNSCGVFIYNNVIGPPISIFDKLPPERKSAALEVYYKNIQLLPLNVRSLERFADVKDSLKVNREDEGTSGYAEMLEPWDSN